MAGPRILWFRHGLRLHDNPALLDAIRPHPDQQVAQLLPIFIFDGETAGTSLVSFNRMTFLLQSLSNLNESFKKLGGRLLIFKGDPCAIFKRLHEELGVSMISFEQDCEPIWRDRDGKVGKLCKNLGIICNERVSHTLWTPEEVIRTNGGIPPLTYEMFLYITSVVGDPPRPSSDPDWRNVHFPQISANLASELNFFPDVPRAEDFGVFPEPEASLRHLVWIGGETEALQKLNDRLQIESAAFQQGFYLPNQACPEILGPPSSLSAYLRFGCLSVRRFYWELHDLFRTTSASADMGRAQHITGQLVWREYFYTMSVRNPKYAQMKDNPICLNIPWKKNPPIDMIDAWKRGETGFPLVDAAMRQLLAEGWLHHTLRNTVAAFLTRGSLWISWEVGFQHFLKHLLDADWSVCAGNWMWVSSSAFQELLDSSKCCCPVAMARRLDSTGEYVKRYVPELRGIPQEFIHEPWKMPRELQGRVKCVIGVDYPAPIVNLEASSERNTLAMQSLRDSLVAKGSPKDGPPHCRPSNNAEILSFFRVSDREVP